VNDSSPPEPDRAAHSGRTPSSKVLRRIRWAAAGLIVLLLIGLGVVEIAGIAGQSREVAVLGWLTGRSAGDGPPSRTGTVGLPEGMAVGGPFQLTDDHGRSVTDANYRGRWMLVYFGYMNCPDACPLTLQKMAAALQDLGPLADHVTPLFITVDPARDTPRQLSSYLENFYPRIVGLTGSRQQIANVAKAYRVYYAPDAPEKSGAYVVGHSSFLYLTDPDGRFNALLPPDAGADQLTIVLRGKLSKR